jgi:two-component system, NarL family, invasion response regulator UvrY
MIKIAIADDHSRLRQAWVFILSRIPGISIVAECCNGEEAIKAVKTHTPDIILMDINMEPVNGIEAAAKIAKHYPSTRIIGMSVHKDMSYVNRMLKAGASGYVTKDSSSKEMIEAIRVVNNGQTYLCEEIRASAEKR